MAIEMGKKYKTRNGKDARLLCTDAGGIRPVVGLVEGVTARWQENGCYYKEVTNHCFDLVEVPETVHIKGWMVSRLCSDGVWSHIFTPRMNDKDLFTNSYKGRKIRYAVCEVDLEVEISD